MFICILYHKLKDFVFFCISVMRIT
jgi:hypothetical protein